MGPLRNKSVSVRLEEEAYLHLRRHSLQSGVPTSALVRALVHRWLQEQETRKGRLWQRGKTQDDAGNRAFSARKKRLE